MDEILKKLDEIIRRISVIESQLNVGEVNKPEQKIEISQQVSGQAQEAVVPVVQETPPLPPPYISESKSVEDKQVFWKEKETLKREMKAGILDEHGWESLIGRWWLPIIGVVAIVFGTSFFLKYAFDNNWIGPVGRVVLGFAGGFLMVGLGEWLRPKFSKYSYFMSAGGVALFYLSVYAAFHFYQLISQPVAFMFMIIVTVFGIGLSLWVDAIELASLATFAGFLVPFLISTGKPNDFAFFSYLTILNLGILVVALFKKWHPLTIIGFVSTVLSFSSWYAGFYEPTKLSFTVFVLSVFYLIYAFAGTIAGIASKKISDNRDLFILLINPAWYFGWVYYLMNPQYHDWLGLWSAVLAMLYFFFAYSAYVLNKEDKNAVLYLGSIGILFLTLAIPLQLEQNVITIAWAIEAAILFILGAVLSNPVLRAFGAVVFVVMLCRLIGYDSYRPENLSAFIPVFNKRFITYLFAIASAGAMGYISRKFEVETEQWEKGIKTALFLVISILVFGSVMMEIDTTFDAKQEVLLGKAEINTPKSSALAMYDVYQARSQARNKVVNGLEYKAIGNQRNTAISVFWTIYAILLMIIGMAYKKFYIRWMALALFGVTIVKVFIFDLAMLKTIYRILSFMALGVILMVAGYMYYLYEKKLKGNESV